MLHNNHLFLLFSWFSTHFFSTTTSVVAFLHVPPPSSSHRRLVNSKFDSEASIYRITNSFPASISTTVTRRYNRETNIPLNAAGVNWSNLIDAAYIISCPNASNGLERLANTKDIVSRVGLMDTSPGGVLIEEFQTDDEDRVRGCYTSHIAVLQKAKTKLETYCQKNNNENNGIILVLEDNISLSGTLRQSLLNDVESFATAGAYSDNWDMIHLSYTPYVPNFLITKTPEDSIVKLSCGIGSALGTTSYLLSYRGIMSILNEHDRLGGYTGESIPDMMARLFPESRYASNPTPFVRAAKTKSLINPQLDDLRELLFQPACVSTVQSIMVTSGLKTNALLPITIALLLLSAGVAGKISVGVAYELITTGQYEGNIIVPILSAVFSIITLYIIGVGVALAPEPQKEEEREEAASANAAAAASVK
mmetsp:Transcript_12564/g.14411  ORF Transcript_12564/g.14411 Transcript_12564/m.14411 type:complete len:422 (+) Transcript_12564:134-1399(+)|eukprot:CAMPEP_0194363812 /NCGR_PEP_ID=MMETSP0174-20130528/11666_1 /TAXON_ID=216777 /ORGANISM="Proboscia alata, Strain PI-D3" /LENGTH=421 /DNA_ID=CAMNT_0039137475 /DNA_START=127 /DNA_END=1392 /DNA_ORIENTATION=-